MNKNSLILGLHGLLSLVTKSTCPLCQRSTAQVLCLGCQRQIESCRFPASTVFLPDPLPVFAYGRYTGALKRMIASLKYDNQPHLAEPLAVWMAEAWLNSAGLPSPRPVLVPVPMHPDKLRQRGFNQAELLASTFSAHTRLPLVRQGLRRSRETTAQFQLSAEAREHNLSGAFSLGPAFVRRPPTQPVLLVDDIYTTGATARAALQTLHRHGIRVQGLIVLARAVKELA